MSITAYANVRNVRPDTANAGLDFTDIFNSGYFDGFVYSFTSFFLRATTQNLDVTTLNISINGRARTVYVNKNFPVGTDREASLLVNNDGNFGEYSGEQFQIPTGTRIVDFRIIDTRYPGLVISDNMRAKNSCQVTLYNERQAPNSFTDFSISQTNLLKEVVFTTNGNANTGKHFIKVRIGNKSPYYDAVGSNGNIATVPSNAITTGGLFETDVRSVYTDYCFSSNIWNTSGITRNINYTYTLPIVTNISISHITRDTPTIISWLGNDFNRWQLELWQDGSIIHSNSGTTQTSCNITVGVIKNLSNVTVKLRLGYNSVYGSYSEKSFTPQATTPTIENLTQVGEYVEKPITMNWRSNNQTKAEVELYQNNVKIKNYEIATQKEDIIPPNTFTQKENCSYRIRPVFVSSFDSTLITYGSWVERNLSLKELNATLDNVSLSGSNIDLQLALSWVSTDQEKFEVQILKSDTVVKAYSGTTATSLNIPPSTLTTGVHIFKVRVAYKDRWTEWKTTQVTLTETLPSIGVLEPDGRIVDRDTAINVYWTSQNQTSWSLNVGGNVFTGSSETSKLLPIGLLSTGRQSMMLTVTLLIAGKTKTTIKTVEFIVQGKPPVPTFTNNATFTTNRPTFTWDSQDCQAYELSCGEYSTGWVNGLVNTCKIADYLSNGQYTARLRVKNQYNIASDYSTQQITINAASTTPTTLRVYNNDTSNTLKWDMTGYVSAYVIRNGERIALAYGEYVDNTCQCENIYQILCVTAAEVAALSNKVVAYNVIDFPVISDGVDMLELIYRTSRNDIKANYSTMSSKQYYSGRKLPITRHGEHDDCTYSFDYAELGEENFFKLLEMVARKRPLLYRSHNKKLWLTFESISYNDNVDNVIYSINAYEVDMSEVVDYE